MKQIIQMDRNMVKNLNWQEANQVAILQAWPRIWTCNYWEQNPASGRGPPGYKSSALTTQQQCLP